MFQNRQRSHYQTLREPAMSGRLLVRADGDCEALSDAEDAPAVGADQVSMGFPKRSLLACLGLLAGTLLLARIHFGGSETKSATLEVIGEATKWTKFGEVPLTLELSGISCPQNIQEQANGKYEYQGNTADGRPFYKHDCDACSKSYYLYYDRECDGEKGGKDNRFGDFQLELLNHPPSTSASEHLINENCFSEAQTTYDSQKPPNRRKNPMPFWHGKAGALPGASVKWEVYCGAKTKLTVQTLSLKGEGLTPSKKLKAKGQWHYVTTVKAGEKRKMTYGFDQKTSKNSPWILAMRSQMELMAK